MYPNAVVANLFCPSDGIYIGYRPPCIIHKQAMQNCQCLVTDRFGSTCRPSILLAFILLTLSIILTSHQNLSKFNSANDPPDPYLQLYSQFDQSLYPVFILLSGSLVHNAGRWQRHSGHSLSTYCQSVNVYISRP